jgi:hypothetical protein
MGYTGGAPPGLRSPKVLFARRAAQEGEKMSHRLASFVAVLATLFALPAGAADLKVISAVA